MRTNKQVLTIARRYLGEGGARFRKFCGLPSGAAWCNAYVDYVAYQGEVSKLYFDRKKETYCPHSIKWCEKNLAQIPLYLAMPMDIIYFDWEKNGVPNHIGLVVSKKTTDTIRTIEGNTDGVRVAEKTRAGKYVQAVFRPHYKGSFTIGTVKVDGSCGYSTIANLQKALGGCAVDGILGKATVKRLQQYLAITQDGQWGRGTSKALQKMLKNNDCYHGAIDGEFGPASVKALQKWINAKNKSEPIKAEEPKAEPIKVTEPAKPVEDKAPKKTAADKIVEQIRIMAWPKGTPKKNWSYKKGRPRNAMKALLKHYGYDTKPEMSDCGNNVNAIVRKSGVDKHFTSLHAVKDPFPKKEDKFKIIISGRVPKVKEMEPADIIRYKKKGGKDQHAMFYLGHNLIADAGHYNRFFNIRKNDFRDKRRNVKKSTIQVLRAKG